MPWNPMARAMKWIRTWAGIALSAVLTVMSASPAGAATYRITVESPLVVREPLQAYPIAPLDLGTRVSVVEDVNMHVSGVHSNGWWVADGIEDYYVGPRGAHLTVYLFTASDIEIPGLAPEGWYEGRVEFTNDGAFSTGLTLSPSRRSLSPPYLAEGRVALCCVNEIVIGFGSMAPPPYLELSHVEVQLDVQPILELTSFDLDGTVSWSALPAGGTVQLLTATDPAGPWQVEITLPSEIGSTMIQPPVAGSNRFFRLSWRENSSP